MSGVWLPIRPAHGALHPGRRLSDGCETLDLGLTFGGPGVSWVHPERGDLREVRERIVAVATAFGTGTA